MVEVFKTNVTNPDQANILIDRIHNAFVGYKANFDLTDCDNILRVKCTTDLIQPYLLINLLHNFGFHAEVLQDDQAHDQMALINEFKLKDDYLF